MKQIFQIDLLVDDLAEFAHMANVCAVPPQCMQVHFKPYGDHRVLRIDIPEEQTAHLKTMLALKDKNWRNQTVLEDQRDPLMRR